MNESLKNAQKRYEKKRKQFKIALRIEEDADVIEWLDRQPNLTESIRTLVRSSK